LAMWWATPTRRHAVTFPLPGVTSPGEVTREAPVRAEPHPTSVNLFTLAVWWATPTRRPADTPLRFFLSPPFHLGRVFL
jgi:hypothetical protein